MKRLINILLLLAAPCLADVDTRPPAAAVGHGAGTVQTALDAWDAAAGAQRADLVPGSGIPGIVSNYYGSLILGLLRPLLTSYTYAFTTNSIAFGPGTTLTVDNLATVNITAQEVDATRLTVTGTLSAAQAFLDFPGAAPTGIHAAAATVTRGRLQAGSAWATNAVMEDLRTPALAAESFPSGDPTVFPSNVTVRGDVYLYSDDTLSEQYSREVVRMTVTTGAVAYAYNPLYVVPSPAGPALTAGRYRAEYKSGSSALATVGLDTTRDIPIAGLGPRGVLDSTFVPAGTSPSTLTGLVSYTVGVYLSPLLSDPVKIDFTALPIPPLPPLPEEGPGWWTVGVVVSPVPEPPGEVVPVDIPSAPDVPPPEPDDPVRCYTPDPDRQFIPDPPPVMAEIIGFSTNSNLSEITVINETIAGAGESRSNYFARAGAAASEADEYGKNHEPLEVAYDEVMLPGILLWQDFTSTRPAHTRAYHYAAYMVRLATTVWVGTFVQTSGFYVYNLDVWYEAMGYPWGHATCTCTDSRSYAPGYDKQYTYEDVLHASGNVIYWISDNPSADAYFGATTVVTLNHKTGAIEADTTYGTSLDDMALPYPLAEQMRIRDWTGEVVARRDYNPTMASSPSGLHALTGDTPYNMEVRRADSSDPSSVYGTSDMTIVADSSGNTMQDSAGGGWYMVTKTPNQDGTVDVTTRGSDGPRVPHGDITAVTATRGFNKAGQSGVWWTFYRKRVCR